MADAKNSFPVSGIIHSMPVRVVQGKKDPSQTYEFRSLVLEVNTGKDVKYTDKKTDEQKTSYKKTTELWKFDVERWVSLDDYSKNDAVELRFSLRGVEYNARDGSKDYMLKAVINFIRFADLDAERPTHDGKIKIDEDYTPRKVENFPMPDPDETDNDLPF